MPMENREDREDRDAAKALRATLLNWNDATDEEVERVKRTFSPLVGIEPQSMSVQVHVIFFKNGENEVVASILSGGEADEGENDVIVAEFRLWGAVPRENERVNYKPNLE